MKKTTKPLSLKPQTVRVLTDAETKRAAGGVSEFAACSQAGCSAFCSIGFTDCCFTHTCNCTLDTAHCEPSYRICG